MTALRRIFTATALVAMASSAAMADSISFSHTTVSQEAPFIDTFSIPGFDTSLGTLNSVTIQLAYTTTAELDVFNATGVPQAFTEGYASSPLTLNGLDGLSLTTNAVAGPIDGVANPGETPFPGLSGGGTLTITVPDSDFSAFEMPPAASTYSVEGAAGSFNGSSVAGVFFGGSASAGGVTTVTYDYGAPIASVPEPTAMALLGSVLVALRLLQRFLQPKATGVASGDIGDIAQNCPRKK
jgi:hypothetical protein